MIIIVFVAGGEFQSQWIKPVQQPAQPDGQCANDDPFHQQVELALTRTQWTGEAAEDFD